MEDDVIALDCSTPREIPDDCPVRVALSCACKSFSHVLTIPRYLLPLRTSVCHCRHCRRTSGQLWASWAVIPRIVADGIDLLPPSTEGLGHYESRVEGADPHGKFSRSVRRYFCRTCGASIFNDDAEELSPGEGDWEVATGCIDEIVVLTQGRGAGVVSDADETDDEGWERVEGEIEEIPVSIEELGLLKTIDLWSNSTQDGGGAIWVNSGKGDTVSGMERHKYGLVSPILTNEDLQRWTNSSRATNTKDWTSLYKFLTGQCACGSVSIFIRAHATKARHLARLCACTTCRKTSGFDITAWFTVNKEYVKVNGGSFSDRLSVGSQGSYSSDSDRRRSMPSGVGTFDSSEQGESSLRCFCNSCGTKFLHVKDGAQMCQLNPGAFGTEADPARLERWLDWHRYPATSQPIHHVEEAINQPYVREVYEGMKKDRDFYKEWEEKRASSSSTDASGSA